MNDVEECRARLDRAQKLIGGLGGEKDRWTVSRLPAFRVLYAGCDFLSSVTVTLQNP